MKTKAKETIAIEQRCKHCGETFNAEGEELYCSDECLQYGLNREKKREPEEERRLCMVCGKPFIPSTPTARLCSEACELKALRDMKRRRAAKRKEERGSPARSKRRGPLTINDVVRWTVQQYKQTGRLISYGKAVVMLEAEQKW
ncbi:MAG: hypothetical protein IJO75_05150 [Clostridia bacterium]|nr:hypothetical protein [Clostridia bacterium]